MPTTTIHGKPAAPVLGALLLSALAYALAQTMVAPALPAITTEFATTSGTSSWVLTGYLLSASVCTPLAGKLGDLFGKARVLTTLLVLFCVGAVACALAPTIEIVIAGRVVMGAAGGVFPLAFGIINDELPADRRAVAIGLMSAMFGIGGGIGLPLAGAIVDHLDISWLFWVGLMALPAAVLVHRLVPPSPPRERTRIDWLGALLLSLGLAVVLLGISKANGWGWDAGRTWSALLGGVALLGLFGAHELRAAQPLVDMRVLAERPVLATNIAGFLVGGAMFGSFLLVPAFVQAPESTGYGLGMTVLQSGLLMLPSSFVMLVAGPLAGHLGNRIGSRAVLLMGTVGIGCSFVVLGLAHGAPVDFMLANVLLGAGIAFGFSAMANLIVGAVDPREVGIATGINTIMRTVGGAFGAAGVTALLTADTIGSSPVPTEHAYALAFWVSVGLSALAFAATLWIPRVRAAVAAPAPRRTPAPV
ncbi:MAG TPA: MFS transporter [Baekduia sp.]|nr:MFS transporter [Baekduia sp.]